MTGTLHKAICSSSRLMSIRTGDFAAVELDIPKPLTDRAKGDTAIKGSFGDNIIFDFGIIL
jgi:hypothetical protein